MSQIKEFKNLKHLKIENKGDEIKKISIPEMKNLESLKIYHLDPSKINFSKMENLKLLIIINSYFLFLNIDFNEYFPNLKYLFIHIFYTVSELICLKDLCRDLRKLEIHVFIGLGYVPWGTI